VIFGTAGVIPVPSTVTVMEFSSESFEGILKLSLNVPAEEGEKRTVRVQLDAGDNV
jgi:hypothetical protein